MIDILYYDEPHPFKKTCFKLSNNKSVCAIQEEVENVYFDNCVEAPQGGTCEEDVCQCWGSLHNEGGERYTNLFQVYNLKTKL